MNNKIVAIFTAINTLHELEQEESKKIFLFRYKTKKEIEKNKNILIEKIKSLANDEWDINYLVNLEETLIAYYPIIHSDDNDSINIPEYKPDILVGKYFYPIYFTHHTDKFNRFIILEVISDNINFTVFDTNTGQNLEISSQYTVQRSQKNIEKICKNILIEYIISYLNKK